VTHPAKPKAIAAKEATTKLPEPSDSVEIWEKSDSISGNSGDVALVSGGAVDPKAARRAAAMAPLLAGTVNPNPDRTVTPAPHPPTGDYATGAGTFCGLSDVELAMGGREDLTQPPIQQDGIYLWGKRWLLIQ